MVYRQSIFDKSARLIGMNSMVTSGDAMSYFELADKKSILKESLRLIGWVFSLLVFGTFGVAMLFIAHNSVEADRKWDALQGQSKSHFIMVVTYRKCRNAHNSGSAAQCQIEALTYGRETGIENAKVIFDEIVSLSNSLSISK